METLTLLGADLEGVAAGKRCNKRSELSCEAVGKKKDELYTWNEAFLFLTHADAQVSGSWQARAIVFSYIEQDDGCLSISPAPGWSWFGLVAGESWEG